MSRHRLTGYELAFWNEARRRLYAEFGQSGNRRSETTVRRRSFASEISLEDVTFRCFLNGSQKSLGEIPRRKLFIKKPDLEQLYAEHLGSEPAPQESEGAAQHVEVVASAAQLELEFDGFDRAEPVVLKLAPGREGVLTVKLKTG